MSTESCREWRESLGAHALGRLPDEERAALEAHLEGCAACRGELESLAGVTSLLPLADPERFGSIPALPPSLADRVVATIRSEHRASRQRKWRLGFSLGGATAAVVVILLALIVLPGGNSDSAPEQHVAFGSAPGGTPVPPGMKISATLIPHAYGTEIHMYVKGAPSGTLCRVFLRGPGDKQMPAGTFRYRWGEDSDAVLSAAMDLSDTRAIGLRIGRRTFVAPLNHSEPA
jgi:Putative zinc-finger